MFYLSGWDVVAVTIALTASLILVVSTILRNIQLTAQRDNYRRAYIIQKDINRAYENHTVKVGK